MARMRKPLEMYVDLRMQNMVQIRKKKNSHFVTNLLFEIFGRLPLGLSALRAPHGGAMLLLLAALSAPHVMLIECRPFGRIAGGHADKIAQI